MTMLMLYLQGRAISFMEANARSQRLELEAQLCGAEMMLQMANTDGPKHYYTRTVFAHLAPNTRSLAAT